MFPETNAMESKPTFRGTWFQIILCKAYSSILKTKQSTSFDTKYLSRTSNPYFSLRSKRFRLVSEQRNTAEGDFRFWPREKWNESQKVKEGGGGGEGRKGRWKRRKEGNVSFLSSPPPPRSFTFATFLAVFDSRSSFFAPKPYRNACYAGYPYLIMTLAG